MNKTYQYRKHIHLFSKIIPLILIPMGILLLIVGVILSFISKENSAEIMSFFGIFSTFIIIESLVTRWIFKRLASTSVSLTDEYILYKSNKEEIQIRYDEIEKVSFPSLKYAGGWIKIISQKKTIRLTVVVEDIHDLLIELKQQLEQHELSHLYKEHSFNNFFKTAIYSDMSWNRMYRIFVKLILSTIALIVISSIVGALTESSVVGLVIFGAIIPTLIYLIAEIFIGANMRKIVNKQLFTSITNDITYENKIFRILSIIGIVTYIIVLGLVVLL